MYQLASDARCADRTQLFMRTCTSLMPTVENLRLVRSATDLVRCALRDGDVQPLRDLLSRAEEWCADVDDVLAAAGQSVIDEMDGLPRAGLHDVVRRVAQIERDALAARTRRDAEFLRPVYAG
jgi:hypothetical protein